MAKKRKQGPKRRRKTPGVSILSPQANSRVGWRIAYVDPDEPEKGRQREAIPSEWRETAETRLEYATRKAKEIAARKRELDRGATRKSRANIAEAHQRWLDSTSDPKTERSRRNTRRFVEWAESEGVDTFDLLHPVGLTSFRDHLEGLPYATSSRNKLLTNLKVFVGWSIEHDLVPFVSEAEMRKRLKPWKAGDTGDEPYKPHEVTAIIEAGLRYDADLLSQPDETGGRPRKKILVTPLLIAVTLSGLRREEAVLILREDFDPQVKDATGTRVGAIKVRPEVGKGGKKRTVTLDFSPALRRHLRQRAAVTPQGEPLFGITYKQAGRAMERLQKEYGAKDFTWKRLRATAASYLSSAPGIFGRAASAQAANRLGHTLATLDKHYLNAIAGLSPEHKTLEDALEITPILDRVFAAARTGDVADIGRSRSADSIAAG